MLSIPHLQPEAENEIVNSTDKLPVLYYSNQLKKKVAIRGNPPRAINPTIKKNKHKKFSQIK